MHTVNYNKWNSSAVNRKHIEIIISLLETMGNIEKMNLMSCFQGNHIFNISIMSS